MNLKNFYILLTLASVYHINGAQGPQRMAAPTPSIPAAPAKSAAMAQPAIQSAPTSVTTTPMKTSVIAPPPLAPSQPSPAAPAIVQPEVTAQAAISDSALASSGKVIFITTREEIDTYVGKGKPVILKVSTEWCGPCKMMKPIFKQVASENPDVVFLCLDADKNKALSQELIGGRGYPTTITYDKDGKQLRIDSGSKGKTELTLDVKEAKGLTMIMNEPPSTMQPAQPMPPRTSQAAPAQRIQAKPVQTQSQGVFCPVPVARTQKMIVTPRNSGPSRGVIVR